jgi:hypothetical protein
MPPAVFAALILSVIVLAGLTLAVAFWAGMPLVSLGLAVLVASLIPGLRRWR